MNFVEKPAHSNGSVADREKQILKFWQENKIFEKLKKKNKGKKRWSFLDGPITANNPMGAHHGWGRTYKDMFQRYKAMRGFDLRWQNGFDCQGLWVEVGVEKDLGFKSKQDIEEYGIAKFVQRCKERVVKYAKIQTEESIRLGQWADWDKSYYTMSDANNYAIWHFLKECHKQGLLYRGKDVVPWCPRCGTAISQHEILTEEYKEITHQAVFVKFPVLGQEKTYFLVWTTTPWTLPGNAALAVHPDLNYAKIQNSNGETYILLREKANLVEPIDEIIETFAGRTLEGMRYKGIFDDLPAVAGQGEAKAGLSHKVILWQDINQEEGTGVVHIAPSCGQEDFALSKANNLPVIELADEQSVYPAGFGFLEGKFVASDEARQWIFDNLKKKHLIYKIEDYKHRYPTCWRCKTALIFRLVNEWFISMEKLRKPLMKIVEKIKWIPSFGKEREIDWLKNMQDWLISKKRYWGLALPVWQCPCGWFAVIGSKEELKKKAVEGWQDFDGKSPHRPFIDAIKIKCAKCGKLAERIKDVGTPWLDAGITPFSTISDDNRSENLPYFNDKRKEWQKWFPADFICESFPGQFKNWFYALLVMSFVLEKEPPFKTLLGYGTVVDEKGEEMHKSKGNAIWFADAVEKIGADTMRWMYLKQNPQNNMRFGYNIAKETAAKLLILVNCYSFFETYQDKLKVSNLSCLTADRSALSSRQAGARQDDKLQTARLPSAIAEGDCGQAVKNSKLLDRWIISRLNATIKIATKGLDNFEPDKAAGAIEDFWTNDLSLWYVRRSKKRFGEAQDTLYSVLLGVCRLIAPMMPFLAEAMYQKLRTNDLPQSVHLSEWPQYDDKMIDIEIEQEMQTIREIVSLALSLRAKTGINVRQPLSKLQISNDKLPARLRCAEGIAGRQVGSQDAPNKNELLNLIKEEVNVKEIDLVDNLESEVALDTTLTDELKEEGKIREIIRQIQGLRKMANLKPINKTALYFDGHFDLREIILRNKPIILETTKSSSAQESPERLGKFVAQKEIEIDGQKIWLGIELLS